MRVVFCWAQQLRYDFSARLLHFSALVDKATNLRVPGAYLDMYLQFIDMEVIFAVAPRLAPTRSLVIAGAPPTEG